jgi:protease I
MADVILVIAQENFHDKELMDTKESIQSKGFRCHIASKTVEKAKGKLGLEISPDITIQDSLLGLDMYKAVVFIGGNGARGYFEDKEALGLAKMANDNGKIVGAICIAPMILAKSGILDCKRATVWNGDNEQSNYFSANHIEYIDEGVCVDGNIVTADGPDSAKSFGEKIAELLE